MFVLTNVVQFFLFKRTSNLNFDIFNFFWKFFKCEFQLPPISKPLYFNFKILFQIQKSLRIVQKFNLVPCTHSSMLKSMYKCKVRCCSKVLHKFDP